MLYIAKIMKETVELTKRTLDMYRKVFKTAKSNVMRWNICHRATNQSFWLKEEDPIERVYNYLRLRKDVESLEYKRFDDPKESAPGIKSGWFRFDIDNRKVVMYTQGINQSIVIEIEGITKVDDNGNVIMRPLRISSDLAGNVVLTTPADIEVPSKINEVLMDLIWVLHI